MVSLELHGFCDASIRAYGCAIYARVTKKCGTTIVNLLTARSRVAPIKKQTLPKLELCGALLLAGLIEKIKPIINNSFTLFLWTDSQIVLHWLKMHSATLSTFVGNRVSEIQDLTTGAHWKHVPTHCNPADLVSRGATVEELAKSIWYNGPTFLYEKPDKWPSGRCGDIDMEVVESIKSESKSAFNATISTNYILEIINQRSSYTSPLRLAARMFRFINKLRHRIKPEDGHTLSSQELHHALLCDLTTNGPLRYLSPFLEYVEGFQILKVGGRLGYPDIPEERKHPILLPNKCDFVMHYVRHLHLKHYQAGPKALVSLIRLQFWVINARDVARRIVRTCVHCVRYKPKLMNQIMGQLPVERLNPSRPFARCGIDFCGPSNVYLRIRGKTPYKAYIAIFVCLATKAVHIELVSDLSNDGFLAALKRMIGRIGLPSDIFCDNATNFIGACNKLNELKAFLFKTENRDAIVRYCANEFVNFNFIPPRAPHFGGIWEAAVKSAKCHLNRSILNARLAFEELTTVLVEIEAVLNSRPIAPLSCDPNDYKTLTPGHFLIGSSLKALPERQSSDNINNLQRWNQITAIKQAFWNRWSHEYINELQARAKWFEERPNINENTMEKIPKFGWSIFVHQRESFGG
ncbi:uncharacterized protein [Eurosta solidaginis]|uniref:uncharacterized protein isoform X2 n=1 Tax=Eurosta solidaginis TaxID=178769 RepID=UPI003530D638